MAKSNKFYRPLLLAMGGEVSLNTSGGGAACLKTHFTSATEESRRLSKSAAEIFVVATQLNKALHGWHFLTGVEEFSVELLLLCFKVYLVFFMERTDFVFFFFF
ncbi:hypothetical protein ACP275_09G021100 [Erythranthe tilingii]